MSQDHGVRSPVPPNLRVKVLQRSNTQPKLLALNGKNEDKSGKSLKKLNDELNVLLPLNSNWSRSTDNLNEVTRRRTISSSLSGSQRPFLSMPSPDEEGEAEAEVYHTVTGGTHKPILASRKLEPFSKIVRRYPEGTRPAESGRKTAMPLLAEHAFDSKPGVREDGQERVEEWGKQGGIKYGCPIPNLSANGLANSSTARYIPSPNKRDVLIYYDQSLLVGSIVVDSMRATCCLKILFLN